MRYVVLLFLLTLIFQSASTSETGSICGIVTDKDTGVPIAHANVVVEGTTFDTLSRGDGSYVITGIPAGEYTIRAMMFGHETQKKYRITITAGSSTEVNFALEQRGD